MRIDGRASVVWVAMLLGACGGNVVVGGAGGGATTPIGSGGGDTTTTITYGTTSLPCPADPPTPGGPCDEEVRCSYAPDPPCATEGVFRCVKGVWQQTQGCAPQPVCPPSEPGEGSPCPQEGLRCDYEAFACGGASAVCQGGAWSVSQAVVECAETCPATVPEAGAYCNICCVTSACTFSVSGCPDVVATCPDGTWHFDAPVCPPKPLSMCGFHGAQPDCDADANCRWLEPGCLDPKLPAAGCFDVADCAADADCGAAGLACVPVVYDPCFGKGCDACSASAKVCLPG